MNTFELSCPWSPYGVCPQECLTSYGPLCDFSDECPFDPKRKVKKCKPEIASETEETNLDDYIKELQDKIYHCLHIPTSAKEGITATEIQKQTEHDFLKYVRSVRSKTLDYEKSILENHERNKPVSTTSEALDMIKFASYLMERCKEVIDNLDKKHPHCEELYSVYSLMQDSIKKMGEESYFLIELYKKFKAFNGDKSTKE